MHVLIIHMFRLCKKLSADARPCGSSLHLVAFSLFIKCTANWDVFEIFSSLSHADKFVALLACSVEKKVS